MSVAGCSVRTMSVKRCARAVGHHARRIEPDQRHRAVAGEQLAHLRLGLLAQVLVVVLLLVRAEVPVVAGAVRIVPVLRLRVVEAEADAALRARVGQLLEDVALERRGVDDVVGADLRIEQREPIVMLRGDDDVLHARVDGELHPLVGVEVVRAEAGRERSYSRTGICARFMIHSPMPGMRLPFHSPAGIA